MSRTEVSCILTLALLGAPLSAHASPDIPDAAARAPDTAFSIGDIVVQAPASAGSPGAMLASVDRMSARVAQGADVENAFELIGQMPGIQVTDFNQGTTSGKFSLRGFNGEGTINAVKLLIDGLPANSNDGNMPQIDMIFPLNIETIEVVRGTADPRHGLHAIAGSANIVTRTGGTYLDSRVLLGSYESYEGQLAAGLERGRFSQNYQVAYRDSQGYRRHSALQRLSLSGKWGMKLGSGPQLQAIARHYRADAQEPGYLVLADSRSSPRMTNAYNASDRDRRTIQQFGLTAQSPLASQLLWSASAYYNRLRDDRYVKFSAAASQQRRLTVEDHHGISTTLEWNGKLAGMALSVSSGANMEWQDNQSLRWLASSRNLTSQTRDQSFTLSVGGAFVQAVLAPMPWLRISPAYRFDLVGGHFTNRLDQTRARNNDYGTIRQPKLAVAILPGDDVTVYGNWGRTFQIGLGSGAYLIPPRTRDLAASINTGWELGVKYRTGDLVEARIAYWEQKATGEIARKLNDPLGDFENVGATRRKGADLQLNLRPTEGLTLWGALAWQKAVISIPAPATPDQTGNEIDHTPRWLWSGGIEWSPQGQLSLGIDARGQSSYHLTNANQQGKWGAMAVFDARLSLRLSQATELRLVVRNLTNDRHEYVWWDGAQSLHSPGNGRHVLTSLRQRW